MIKNNFKFLLSFLTIFISQTFFSQQYPVSKIEPIKISKHKIETIDNFTWLEKMKSDEVNNWVNAQNEVTNNEFKKIRKEYSTAFKIKEYDAYSSNGLPIKKGKYFYNIYRKDKNEPASLFLRKTLNDDLIEIANPFKVYKNPNSYLTDFEPSKFSKLLAYSVSINGSDQQEIRFTNLENQNNLNDVLQNVKFSKLDWNQDKGLFYKKNVNTSTFAKDSTYQLYYHKIDTKQIDDELVFDTSKSQNGFRYFSTPEKLFVIEQDNKTGAKNYYYSNLSNNEPIKLIKFIENDLTKFKFLDCIKDRIYFSDNDFDWGEISSFDINNRQDEKHFISQLYNSLLLESYFYDNYIICKYKTVGKNYLMIYNKEGEFVRKFDAPTGMDFTVKFYNNDTKDLFVSFYSYTVSYQNFKLNLETGKASRYYNDYMPLKESLFLYDHFETKVITFKSRDNEDIPITIVHKKGITLDGNNPTLLKAYGGYGIVSAPNYDTGLLTFLEKGGVFAFAEIRGGGEKGAKWHRDGKGLKKINNFNDFIDAAEFLIKEKYTNPNKLAITGGSQGGLLVGGAMIMRPDLFKLVIPIVAVFDMIQYNKFTVGNFWEDEFGNPEKELEYKNLLSYSPYHNIKKDVNYPTTLIVTSKNDDRVPPFHSYKFAAALQNRPAQKNPILLRTFDNSGHSGKISNYKEYIDEKAEFYDFLLYYLN